MAPRRRRLTWSSRQRAENRTGVQLEEFSLSGSGPTEPEGPTHARGHLGQPGEPFRRNWGNNTVNLYITGKFCDHDESWIPRYLISATSIFDCGSMNCWSTLAHFSPSIPHYQFRFPRLHLPICCRPMQGVPRAIDSSLVQGFNSANKFDGGNPTPCVLVEHPGAVALRAVDRPMALWAHATNSERSHGHTGCPGFNCRMIPPDSGKSNRHRNTMLNIRE